MKKNINILNSLLEAQNTQLPLPISSGTDFAISSGQPISETVLHNYLERAIQVCELSKMNLNLKQ